MILISTGWFNLVIAYIALHHTDALTEQEIKGCLASHNKLRALHENTNPLQWDEGIALLAQRYAEKLLAEHQGRTTTNLVHDKAKNGLGENLYWGDNSKSATCAKASLAWYNEIDDYDYRTAKTKNGKAVGHFTQLVWTDTKSFGVGIATGTSRMYADYGNVETFIVAKYAPRGNFYYRGRKLETYTEKVKPRKYGVVTPSLFELDPYSTASARQPCNNNFGEHKCNKLINEFGYNCKGKYENYFKKNCYKTCAYC